MRILVVGLFVGTAVGCPAFGVGIGVDVANTNMSCNETSSALVI